MTPDEKTDLFRRMKVPTIAFGALLGLLAVNVVLGATMPFADVWIIELLVALSMVVVVLVFSMEILQEPPLNRLFSVAGFCWLGILFTMTLIDYLTRRPN